MDDNRPDFVSFFRWVGRGWVVLIRFKFLTYHCVIVTCCWVGVCRVTEESISKNNTRPMLVLQIFVWSSRKVSWTMYYWGNVKHIYFWRMRTFGSFENLHFLKYYGKRRQGWIVVACLQSSPTNPTRPESNSIQTATYINMTRSHKLDIYKQPNMYWSANKAQTWANLYPILSSAAAATPHHTTNFVFKIVFDRAAEENGSVWFPYAHYKWQKNRLNEHGGKSCWSFLLLRRRLQSNCRYVLTMCVWLLGWGEKNFETSEIVRVENI